MPPAPPFVLSCYLPAVRRFLPVLIVLFALVLPRAAHAFERQWHAGADVGWSVVTHKDRAYGGYGGGAHLTYGLTDAFDAMLQVGVTGHPVYTGYPWMTVSHASLGAVWTFDVLRWVPYAGLLVGGYHFSSVGRYDKAEWKLGFQATLGLDYAFSRSWAAGLQVRYHTFSDEPFTAHYLTTFVRAEYRWGW
jgi:opacity protein-like surface antigen